MRYLDLLGIDRQKPNFEILKAIINAHITKIPFENISKLFYFKRLNLKQLIDFELFLEGIERYGFGGTCYSSNYYLNQLLEWLGYEIKLCGADMKEPDVHIVSIVNYGDREYLVDTGYAAPFLEPLPLDLTNDFEIVLGNSRYVLKRRDSNKRSQVELYRNGLLSHGYSVNPLSRRIEEFQKVIADSFKESATFTNALLLARFEPNYSFVIHNMTAIESNGKISDKYSLDTLDELITVIENQFGIPGDIVRESVSDLKMGKDVWS